MRNKGRVQLQRDVSYECDELSSNRTCRNKILPPLSTTATTKLPTNCKFKIMYIYFSIFFLFLGI